MKNGRWNSSVKWILVSLLALAMLLSHTGIFQSGKITRKTATAETISGETAGSAAVAPEETAEWTVMFYLCGSDLESRYGYATNTLAEIADVHYPDNLYAFMAETYGVTPDEDERQQPGKVNVLIETGGSREWHAGSLGMDIDPSVLQRWSYNTYLQFGRREDEPDDGFELMETLPLQSMADPGTLSDFIRWGVAARPAKKYALVLWDHGDGARTGLFIDELFDRDILCLYELRQALQDSGVYFDAVIFDSCLMANIETAWNIRKNAGWMVASEETIPGKGTAVAEWLQQLFCYPESGGEWLGRCVCDTTAVKYTNENDKQARETLTWSVTDLTKAEALAESMEGFFRILDESLQGDVAPATVSCIKSLFQAAEYGEGGQHMRDFGSVVYQKELARLVPRSVRNAAIQALSDAVVYCVHGPGRSEARGLTFCYPVGYTGAELDTYSRNFPMPYYLAYIDAISDWNAPDWVYEYTERLPHVDSMMTMQIDFIRKLDTDGMPGIEVLDAETTNLDMICYTLYMLNPETGETLRLGRTNCIENIRYGENATDRIWRAADPMHWPSVDGQLMCMELIQVHDQNKLYNVPVMMNSQTCILRLGRNVNYAENEAERINEYEIYGLWEGYEENSALMSRTVQPLSALTGREYHMLYPIDGANDRSGSHYEINRTPLTMYRALDVREIPLPEGTYYLEYEIDDRFMRRTVLDRIEIRWDGETMTISEADAWADEIWINFADLRQTE